MGTWKQPYEYVSRKASWSNFNLVQYHPTGSHRNIRPGIPWQDPRVTMSHRYEICQDRTTLISMVITVTGFGKTLHKLNNVREIFTKYAVYTNNCFYIIIEYSKSRSELCVLSYLTSLHNVSKKKQKRFARYYCYLSYQYDYSCCTGFK